MALLNALFAPFRALLNLLFSSPVRVEGDSMFPTLGDRHLVLMVRPVFPWYRVRRGDVVVLLPPSPTQGLPEGTWFIKRVAGLPGEEIVLAGGCLYADDVLLAELRSGARPAGREASQRSEWWNGPDEYFVLGDNPGDSRDSRTFGSVPTDQIIGRVWFRIWPLGSVGPVR